MYESADGFDNLGSVANGVAGSPTRLLLAIERRLLRDAIAALVGRDDRFRLAVATPGERGWNRPPSAGRAGVALLDANSDEAPLRRLLVDESISFGVLLCDDAKVEQAFTVNHGPARIGEILFAVKGYDTPWAEIADALLRRGGGPKQATKRGSRRVDRASEGAGDAIHRDLQLYASLSRREREVLSAIGKGLSPSEIAKQMHVARSTAENHKSRLMKKIGVHKSTELVRFAVRVGAAPL